MNILDGYDYHEAKHKTEKILYEPWLILVKVWSESRCPASRYIYGDKKHKLSTHFSWHDSFKCFVQCVSMDNIACYGERISIRSATNNTVRNIDRKCISITCRNLDDKLLFDLIENIRLCVPGIRGICFLGFDDLKIDSLTVYQESS